MISRIIIRYFLCCFIAIFSLNCSSKSYHSDGDHFRAKATEYMAKAFIYRNKGQDERAQLYMRMAKIKRYAAALVDNGYWYDLDWDVFYMNARKISQGEDTAQMIAKMRPRYHKEDALAAK